MFQKFSLICPTKFKFFLYPNRYSPILVLIELKQIDFIEKPVLDFKIVEICLSLIMLFWMIFIVVMMLGTFLNYLMSKLLTITGLKFADRLLGGVFGVARGVIIVLVILFISGLFLSETEQWQQSTLIPYGLWMTEWLRMFVGDTNSVYLTQ